MSTYLSDVQQAANSYLQRADIWVAATLPRSLILCGCGLGVGLLIADKLPVAELLSRPIHSLEKSRPDLAKKISWVVPVGGIALSAGVTFAAFRATPSSILRMIVLGVVSGIGAQLLDNPKREVISLGKLFRSWSGVDEESISPALNNLANVISLIATITLAVLCKKLGHLNILTSTLAVMMQPAVHTLLLKVAQSWNDRTSSV